jgi:hypothetical protein
MHDEWSAEREAERLRLIREVEAAFNGVALGNGVSLHQARAMDDYASDAEVAAARAMDTEERWQEVPDEKLDRLADTLPFMDAEGFRFYLPRFMLFALKHSEGSEYSSSWACGTAIYWSDLRDTTGKHALLTREQREAVRTFGEYFRDEQ